MRVFISALLLVAGAVLMTFSGLSFTLFPRPLTLSDPGLLVEALFLAGFVLAALATRRLYDLHRETSRVRLAP